MSVVFNAATAANVSILQTTNQLFQVSQKRVATGKSIFGAADDATRYTMSQTMLSRSKNINAVNNNISTALKTLESTDNTLKQVRNLLQQMNTMATQALNAGSSPTVATTSTNTIGETTVVAGYSTGHRLSITSDSGKNFTFTFGSAAAGTGSSANTKWGDVANALNSANIGVEIKFESATNTAGALIPRMVIRSTDGKTGFSVDGNTSAQVIDDMTGLSSGYDGTYASSKFANGSASPTGWAAGNPFGMRFGTGGAVTNIAAMPTGVSAGSSISFVGADGVARTWSTTAAKSSDTVASEINALNAGVRAEFSAGGFLRLRKLDGTAMTILNGTGNFDSNTGAQRFNTTAGQPVVQGNPILGSTNNDRRLELGQQFESYKTEITRLIDNNPVQAGRNLLKGEGMSIILNEFAANPIAITGVNTSVTGNLGLTTVGTTWTVNTNIETSLGQVQTAQATIDKMSASFGNYASFVRERYDLNREFSVNLKTLGDDLVAADVAEESAKLTALQTQQQFAVQAFSAGSANAQSLLRLLG